MATATEAAGVASRPARWPEAMSDAVLAEYLSVSKRTVWKMNATEQLPAPVKLGDGCTRWLKSRVDQHLEELRSK